MRRTTWMIWLAAAVAVGAAFGMSSRLSSDLIAARPAAALTCNLTNYKATTGLTAALEGDLLTVSWNGQGTSQVRARFAVDGGTPTIRDLSVRSAGGAWAVLGQNLTPEYRVTTGVRRMSNDQANALSSLGIDVTQEVIDKHRWYAFWDAPFSIPGTRRPQVARAAQAGAAPAPQAPGPAHCATGAASTDVGRGRNDRRAGGRDPVRAARETRIQPLAESSRLHWRPRPGVASDDCGNRRAVSAFSASACDVKTDGSSLAVTFPGMTLGTFEGSLRFTVYRATNLMQMDAIARTNEPWVAYKYDAGLKGFSTSTMPRVIWRDTGGWPQRHQFGGPTANGLSVVRASNRLLVAEGPRGSVATFPPPHTFFFTREVDVNLG